MSAKTNPRPATSAGTKAHCTKTGPDLVATAQIKAPGVKMGPDFVALVRTRAFSAKIKFRFTAHVTLHLRVRLGLPATTEAHLLITSSNSVSLVVTNDVRRRVILSDNRDDSDSEQAPRRKLSKQSARTSESTNRALDKSVSKAALGKRPQREPETSTPAPELGSPELTNPEKKARTGNKGADKDKRSLVKTTTSPKPVSGQSHAAAVPGVLLESNNLAPPTRPLTATDKVRLTLA